MSYQTGPGGWLRGAKGSARNGDALARRQESMLALDAAILGGDSSSGISSMDSIGGIGGIGDMGGGGFV